MAAPDAVTVRLRRDVPRRPGLLAEALLAGHAVRDALPRRPRVAITLTNNRRRLVGLRTRPGAVDLSLHWTLADQGPALVALLVDRSADAGRRVQQIHAARTRDAPPRPRPRTRLRTAGSHHDLAALQAQVQAACFDSAAPGPITWGRMGNRPRSARSRSLRFGSHAPDGLIRIHPVLDHPTVPAWFVSYVIFHELLHGRHPPEVGPSGRRRVHTPAFRAAERAHPDHARAERWRRAHLVRLVGMLGG